MPDETLFAFEQTLSRADVARYLRSLAEQLEGDGAINFASGAQQTSVEVPDRVSFEVEVERDTPTAGGQPPTMSIEVELEWLEGDDGGGLEIS